MDAQPTVEPPHRPQNAGPLDRRLVAGFSLACGLVAGYFTDWCTALTTTSCIAALLRGI